MEMHALRGIEIRTEPNRLFDFVSEATNLPQWTHAFSWAESGRALMRTPDGEVEIGLEIEASREHGTIDWVMVFPDGSVARAFSRIVELGNGVSHYSFVLPPPPGPLEQLEGELEEQSRTLESELSKLKEILENDP